MIKIVDYEDLNVPVTSCCAKCKYKEKYPYLCNMGDITTDWTRGKIIVDCTGYEKDKIALSSEKIK